METTTKNIITEIKTIAAILMGLGLKEKFSQQILKAFLNSYTELLKEEEDVITPFISVSFSHYSDKENEKRVSISIERDKPNKITIGYFTPGYEKGKMIEDIPIKKLKEHVKKIKDYGHLNDPCFIKIISSPGGGSIEVLSRPDGPLGI